MAEVTQNKEREERIEMEIVVDAYSPEEQAVENGESRLSNRKFKGESSEFLSIKPKFTHAKRLAIAIIGSVCASIFSMVVNGVMIIIIAVELDAREKDSNLGILD